MIRSLDALVLWLSLYDSRDQWSDLSIILQLSYVSCVKLVSIVLEESGVSSNRVLIYWKCSQELMWALISELFIKILGGSHNVLYCIVENKVRGIWRIFYTYVLRTVILHSHIAVSIFRA